MLFFGCGLRSFPDQRSWEAFFWKQMQSEIAPCPGDSYIEDDELYWREGCEDCLRRTNPDRTLPPVQLPLIIVFECECRISS